MFIQMDQFICCILLFATPNVCVWVGEAAWDFSRDFTINMSPQCRAFIRPLLTEKLKAALFPSQVFGM